MVDVNDPNEYNGEEVEIVAAVFLGLTMVAVFLRFCVRVFITKSFSADDWLMLISQIVFTLSCSFVLLGVKWGLGHHNKTLPQQKEIEALKYQALATITYVINMMFIKLSIGVFLLRIAVLKRYIWILRISMAIILVWSTAIIFYQFFQCSPVAFQWDYTIPGGKCASGESFVAAAYSISVMTIVSDWLYSIMPMFMIWNVKMTTQKKMTVAFVLSLGVFASVATLIRLKYLIELGDYSDNLYTANDAMVWTLIEPGIAIIAACLVTIRPLLHALHLSGFGSTKNSSTYGLPGYGRGGLSLRGDIPNSNTWNQSTIESQAGGPSNGGIQLSASGSVAGRMKGRKSPAGVRVKEFPADSASEEHILEGIVRTVDVTVSRDSGRGLS